MSMRKGSARSELVGFAVLGLAALPIFVVDPAVLSELWGGNEWLWFLGLFCIGVIGWIAYKRIIAPRRSWLMTALARSRSARAVLVLASDERPGFTCALIPESSALIVSAPDEADRSIPWSRITNIASRREPVGVLHIVDVTTVAGEFDLSFYLLESDAVSMASAAKTATFVSELQKVRFGSRTE